MNALTLGGINDWLHQVWFKHPANSDLAVEMDGSLKFAGVDWLFMVILWISIVSFLLIVVPMCWWAWKYRRRPGHTQQRTPNHNTVMEVTWVVLPLIILVFIFFWGFHGFMKAHIWRGDALTLYVTGKKWDWAITYPNGANSAENKFADDLRNLAAKEGGQRGNKDAPVIIVPVGQPIRFMLSSEDVIHSFFIPDMRVKTDVFPNRYTSYTFTPLHATEKTADGRYKDHPIYCAEYCGTMHSEMTGWLRVLPADEYERVITEWGNVIGDMHKKNKKMWELGQYVYSHKSCSNCHTIDGTTSTGPSWKGSYGKPVEFSTSTGGTFDLSTEEGWANYIRESILIPGAKIHKGFEAQSMTPFAGQVTEFEVAGVIEYFKYLNGKGTDKPVPDPKDPANGDKMAK